MSELDPKKYIVGKDVTVSDIDLDKEAFIHQRWAQAER